MKLLPALMLKLIMEGKEVEEPVLGLLLPIEIRIAPPPPNWPLVSQERPHTHSSRRCGCTLGICKTTCEHEKALQWARRCRKLSTQRTCYQLSARPDLSHSGYGV